MSSYRKKQVTVEAEQWTGTNWPTMLKKTYEPADG